ncbi:hypothetical protein N7489_004781 [Penicillium chrysogenum]|uniref:uncharacterized protein n=1 Tax=Penicillium chrysogenum TaxID=5076 RepID=UPI0024DF1448|nr:uncharacterized protein N7489_004781 [Penicillium chrysogenum]KAJ5244685.1 hypothetical protein N7489_004781 [Penicillium chrysogenum]
MPSAAKDTGEAVDWAVAVPSPIDPSEDKIFEIYEHGRRNELDSSSSLCVISVGYTTWAFDTHPGAWRRILMNVLGNALKYTPSGYIYVGLTSYQSCASRSQMGPVNQSLGEQNQELDVTLTVKDTGKGIGSEYLQNHLFTPFMQEDPLASVGTELTIRIPLTHFPGASDTSSSDSVFNSLQTFTQVKTIGLLGFGLSLRSHRDTALYSSLERLCRDWFGLKVASVSLLKDEPVPFDFTLPCRRSWTPRMSREEIFFALNNHLDGGNGSSRGHLPVPRGSAYPEYRVSKSSVSVNENSREVGSQIIARPTSALEEGQGNSELPSPFVLLVDDNDLNLRLLCAYTKMGNYEYMTAQNGAEAVATYKAHPGKFRLVILDISMPVMDGFEAARQIRRLEKEYRAGLGLDSHDVQKEAFGSGIDTFLIKPVQRPDLYAILERMEQRD